MEANIRRGGRNLPPPRRRLASTTRGHKVSTIARTELEAGALGIPCAKLGRAEVMAAVESDLLIANIVVGAHKAGVSRSAFAEPRGGVCMRRV